MIFQLASLIILIVSPLHYIKLWYPENDQVIELVLLKYMLAVITDAMVFQNFHISVIIKFQLYQ